MEVGINVSAKLQGYRQAVEMLGKLIVKITKVEFMGSPNFNFPHLSTNKGNTTSTKVPLSAPLDFSLRSVMRTGVVMLFFPKE